MGGIFDLKFYLNFYIEAFFRYLLCNAQSLKIISI